MNQSVNQLKFWYNQTGSPLIASHSKNQSIRRIDEWTKVWRESFISKFSGQYFGFKRFFVFFVSRPWTSSSHILASLQSVNHFRRKADEWPPTGFNKAIGRVTQSGDWRNEWMNGSFNPARQWRRTTLMDINIINNNWIPSHSGSSSESLSVFYWRSSAWPGIAAGDPWRMAAVSSVCPVPVHARVQDQTAVLSAAIVIVATAWAGVVKDATASPLLVVWLIHQSQDDLLVISVTWRSKPTN